MRFPLLAFPLLAFPLLAFPLLGFPVVEAVVVAPLLPPVELGEELLVVVPLVPFDGVRI